MTWVRFDDNAPDHPKLASISDAAFRLWFDAMCYCNRMLTDGAIPAAMIAKLHPKRPEQAANELVEAGLWDSGSDGYSVHDYNDFQPKRAEVLSKRAAESARKKRGSGGRVIDPVPVPVPVPVPDPYPIPDPDPSRPQQQRAFRAVEDLLGSLPKPVIDKLLAVLEDTPDEWIVAACEEAATANGRSWNYLEVIINRWKRDGFKADRRSHATTQRSATGTPGRASAGRTARF